jgi:hypothetical protein
MLRSKRQLKSEEVKERIETERRRAGGPVSPPVFDYISIVRFFE